MESLYKSRFRAMGSPCQIKIYANTRRHGEQAIIKAIQEIARLERKYTRYQSTSVTSKINRSLPHCAIPVDEETASLLNYANTAYHESDGAFDITSGVLREVWNFRRPRVPTAAEVARVLRRVGWDKVIWDGSSFAFTQPEMEIDFGGYVKEYAVDAAVAVLTEFGVRSGLVDLGGDIRIIGPHPDDQPWKVGIANPVCPEKAITTLQLNHGAVASSGDYQRCFTVGGQKYCHILDPKTGWPVQLGLSSVTIVADQCMVAGSCSTLAMLQNENNAVQWLQDLGLQFIAVNNKGSVIMPASACA